MRILNAQARRGALAGEFTSTRRACCVAHQATKGQAFPVEDKAPAVAAERLVGRALKSGFVTPAQADTIREKAKRSSPSGRGLQSP